MGYCFVVFCQRNKWNYLFEFIIFAGLFFRCDGQGACTEVNGRRWAEKCLFDNLITNSGYEANVLPRLNISEHVEVQIGFNLRGLTGINEKDEIMTVVGFLVAVWNDPYLTWDRNVYAGTEQIVFPTNKIWYPDIAISNSADSFYDVKFSTQFRTLVYWNGDVIWRFGDQFAVSCSLDITYYPFDEQQCQIDVENWAYEENDVDLVSIDHWGGGSGVQTNELQPHSLWELVETYGKVTSQEDSDASKRSSTYPKVSFFFKWRRKTRFYTFNFIIPSAFLTAMTLGLFWLPSDCGEKISFGITVMLSFTVYQVILMDSIPVNSESTPVLNTLLIAMIAGALISLLTSMMSVYLTYKGSVHHVPKIIRIVFLGRLARILCVKSHPCPITENKLSHQDNDSGLVIIEDVDQSDRSRTPAKKTKSTTEEEILKELRKLTAYLKEKEDADIIAEDWKMLAKVIDRSLFWIYVFGFVMFVAVYGAKIDTS